MKARSLLPKTAILFSIFSLFALTFSHRQASAQSDPLSLAEVLTALQSKSSGLTLAKKNAFILERVEERGVTFRLTPDLEKELITAGANAALINAIRLNSPRATTPTPTRTPVTTPTPVRSATKPTVEFEKLWVDYDVTQDDEKGMRIHTKLTVYNLINIPAYLAVYFEKTGGELLKTTNTQFASTNGQVAVFREFTPIYDAAAFSDLSVFIPYKELNLPPGDFDLTLKAKLIYKPSGLIADLETYKFVFTNPKPAVSSTKEIITLDKISATYNITENRKLGMRVNLKLTIQNMKGIDSQVALFFEKQNGEKLYSSNVAFQTKGGHTAVYKDLTPCCETTVYGDLTLFIPYEEFGLAKGSYNLQVHADLIYPNGELLKHLDFYKFTYSKD